MTVELIDVGPTASTNLVVNGDFELGDPAPYCWNTEKDAKRVFPGFNSSAALELREAELAAAGRAGDRGRAVRGARHLDGRASASGLRGAGGAGRRASSFSTISAGRSPVTTRRLLADVVGQFRLASRHGVRAGAARRAPGRPSDRARPTRSARFAFDDVRITASPNPDAGSWTPFHVTDDTDDWLEVPPSAQIKAESALDVSFLLRGTGRRPGIGDRQERASDVRRQGAGAVLRRLPLASGRVSCGRGSPSSLPIAWPARASTWCVWAISTPRTGPIAACSTTRATTPRSSIRSPSPGWTT